MKKDKDFCYVVIGRIEDYKDNNVLPVFVKESLSHISNQRVIDQKRSSYGLLKEAVKNLLGFDDDFSSVKSTPSGKPFCKDYYFSISHSNEFVVVALSNTNVGVDIERIDESRNLNNLKRIILHENEKHSKVESIDDLLLLWVKKEAKFKFDDGKVFVASKIDTQTFTSFTKLFNCGDDRYWIGVVTKQNEVQFKSMLK